MVKRKLECHEQGFEVLISFKVTYLPSLFVLSMSCSDGHHKKFGHPPLQDSPPPPLPPPSNVDVDVFIDYIL